MSVAETVLVFVIIPAAIVLLIAAPAYAGGARRGSKRYRPGRPFEFMPVWFLSAPERLSAATGSAELTAGPHREAIAGTIEGPAVERPEGEQVSRAGRARSVGGWEDHGTTGGASDRW